MGLFFWVCLVVESSFFLGPMNDDFTRIEAQLTIQSPFFSFTTPVSTKV